MGELGDIGLELKILLPRASEYLVSQGYSYLSLPENVGLFTASLVAQVAGITICAFSAIHLIHTHVLPIVMNFLILYFTN